jgi:hypothetical protein
MSSTAASCRHRRLADVRRCGGQVERLADSSGALHDQRPGNAATRATGEWNASVAELTDLFAMVTKIDAF